MSALRCAVFASFVFLSSVFAQTAADPYAEVLHYRISQPRKATLAIETEIHSASPAQLRVIEGKLLRIIQSPEATLDGKTWACRQLRQAGSEQSIPILGGLLSNKDLSDAAQFALRSIPGPKVDAVLREALGKVPADLRAGVIQTIGARADRTAVPLLAPMASDADPTVAETALYALGQIGGAPALKAVQNAKVPAQLLRYRSHALLLCAESLLAEGQTAGAAGVYGDLYQDAPDTIIKIGALRGMIRADPEKSAPLLLAALKDGDARLRASAAAFACQSAPSRLLAKVLAEVSSLPGDVQLALFSSANDPAVLPAARAAAQGADPAARLAALGALGRLGNGSDVPLLLGRAVASQGEEQAAARKALQRLHAKEVDRLLVASAQKGESVLRVAAIQTLASRQAIMAVPALLPLARDREAAIRAEAFKALGAIAPSNLLPELLGFVGDSEQDRPAAEAAAIAICQRSKDKEGSATAVIAALPGPNPASHCSLLRVLAQTSAPKALDALGAATKDADTTVQTTALHALANWPDAAAMPALLGIVRTASTPAHRTLAFRGYVRLAREGETSAEAKLKTLSEAAQLATSPEEKKLVIGALGDAAQPGAVALILQWLPDAGLEQEAASAVVRIAKQMRKANRQAAGQALERVVKLCRTPAARQIAEGAMLPLDTMQNIAPQGIATSPDGWQKDGAAGGDQAGIDGDPNTYWDKEDGKALYRYVVTFKQPEKIAALSILGYAHHNFAPKDFEILGDGKVLKKIDNAQYDENFLTIAIAETACTSVELRITGYYGGSPAIRELGIYRPGP